MNDKAELNEGQGLDAVVRVPSSLQVETSCPTWKSVSTIRKNKLSLHVYKKKKQTHVSYLFICIYIIKKNSSNTCFNHPHMTMSDTKLYAFIYCAVE